MYYKKIKNLLIKNKSVKFLIKKLYLNININIKFNTIKVDKLIDYSFEVDYNVNVNKEKNSKNKKNYQ